jgi:hypothetical protein
MNITSAEAISIHAVSPAVTDETGVAASPCAHALPATPRNSTDRNSQSLPLLTMDLPSSESRVLQTTHDLSV